MAGRWGRGRRCLVHLLRPVSVLEVVAEDSSRRGSETFPLCLLSGDSDVSGVFVGTRESTNLPAPTSAAGAAWVRGHAEVAVLYAHIAAAAFEPGGQVRRGRWPTPLERLLLRSQISGSNLPDAVCCGMIDSLRPKLQK